MRGIDRTWIRDKLLELMMHEQGISRLSEPEKVELAEITQIKVSPKRFEAGDYFDNGKAPTIKEFVEEL